MGNPLAIAAVTATFNDLLDQVSQDPLLAGISVTNHPPDLVDRSISKPRQLNLFLYQVAPNAAWRNADLPFRNENGDRTARPQLALNMHYLVTAYGVEDDEMDGQHVLACAMSLVHDNSVLTRDQIKKVVSAGGVVKFSDLADQVELVKLTPQPLSSDDLFKLWSAFQTHYRLSVAYEAAVVLIDRPHPTRVAPPVRKADLLVVPIETPVIDSIDPQIAQPGGTIVIRGRHLRGITTTVRVDTTVVTPPAPNVLDASITFTLPMTIAPGLTTVQVLRPVDLGEPPVPHDGFQSNIVAFLLTPVLTGAIPATVARGATLTLTLMSAVAHAQSSVVLLDDSQVPVAWQPADPDPSTTIRALIPNTVPPGPHVLRVRIDGATSDVARNPVTNLVTAPIVTVT